MLRGDPALQLDARPVPWCPSCRDYHAAGRCPEAIAGELRRLPFATAAAAFRELVA